MRLFPALLILFAHTALAQVDNIVLHAARLLDVETGRILSPGEVLVRGDDIAALGFNFAGTVKRIEIERDVSAVGSQARGFSGQNAGQVESARGQNRSTGR